LREEQVPDEVFGVELVGAHRPSEDIGEHEHQVVERRDARDAIPVEAADAGAAALPGHVDDVARQEEEQLHAKLAVMCQRRQQRRRRQHLCMQEQHAGHRQRPQSVDPVDTVLAVEISGLHDTSPCSGLTHHEGKLTVRP
jgi:hypothetical protein